MSQSVLSLLGVCSHLSEESRAAKGGGRKSETAKDLCRPACVITRSSVQPSGKHTSLLLARHPLSHHPYLVALWVLFLARVFLLQMLSSSPTPLSKDFCSCLSLLLLFCLIMLSHLQAQIQIPYPCPRWLTDLLPYSIYPSGGLSIWHHPKDTLTPAEAQHGGNRAAQLTALGHTTLPQEHAACPTGTPRRHLWLWLLLISSETLFFSEYHFYAVVFHLLWAKIPVQASGISNLSYSHLLFFLAPTNTLSSNLYPARTLLRASFPHGWLWLCCCHRCPSSPALPHPAEAPSLWSQGPPVHPSLTRYNFCLQLALNMSLICLLERFSDKHLCPFTPTTPQAWDGHTTNTRAAAALSSVKIIVKSLWDALRKSLLWTVPVLSSFLICRTLLLHHFPLLSLPFVYFVISLCLCFGTKLSSTGPIFFP